MICPLCGKDGSSRDGTQSVYKNDEHDHRTYKRRGIFCFHCMKAFETIEKPTGEAYHKRPMDDAQMELLMDSVTKSRNLATWKKKRFRELRHEIHGIHRATEPNH